MRVWVFAFVALLGCDDDVAARTTTAAATSAPGEEAEVEPASEPSPAPPAPAAVISCEGLARWCGGWTGCIRVRERRDDDGTLHYEGLDALEGHTYLPDASCAAGELCNDVCDPATGVCRPGVLEDISVACSRSGGPSRAPFFCELVDGACVQHDLPPPAVHAGGRS